MCIRDSYLGDLNDHGIIVFDTVDMLNNRATELIQLYHSMISNTTVSYTHLNQLGYLVYLWYLDYC